MGKLLFGDFVNAVSDFFDIIDEERDFLKNTGIFNASFEELAERNKRLFFDVAHNYDKSFANPEYAVKTLGEECGSIISAFYAEMRSVIGFVYEGDNEEIELRRGMLQALRDALKLAESGGKMPDPSHLKELFSNTVKGYTERASLKKVSSLVNPDNTFLTDILMKSDLEDLRYLYAYGEYISANELKIAEYLNSLSDEKLNKMADTYTEGYIRGFELTGKDLSKKKTVDIRYNIGFERMMRRAVDNFEKIGLRPIIYRAASSVLYNASIFKVGVQSTSCNRQYEYDHKDDKALFFDWDYVNLKLSAMENAFEKYKEEARGYAGPAVVETFGEPDFAPVIKPECVQMLAEQNELSVEYKSRLGILQRQYILEEERSFTIIAFPMPEIKSCLPDASDSGFSKFFDEVIAVNTLDYQMYRDIQATMIETLNKADYCIVRGMNGNKTDIRVELCKLKNPEKETIFENCVADVNIPVGEVFTSPVLKGTSGILNVSRVFLNGLEYKNLTIEFKDGMIESYSCDNFDSEDKNRNFINENVLYRHKSLPMGEFAIGTNTTAYTMARKYNISGKLPILIAEKTGPHFAVGDTCYSHAEDIAVFNPDGKEIVARDNEISILRKSKDAKNAYFNCHTDITIPYDELGELNAVTKDGSVINIIKNGRFVLPGTEELNDALKN